MKVVVGSRPSPAATVDVGVLGEEDEDEREAERGSDPFAICSRSDTIRMRVRGKRRAITGAHSPSQQRTKCRMLRLVRESVSASVHGRRKDTIASTSSGGRSEKEK